MPLSSAQVLDPRAVADRDALAPVGGGAHFPPRPPPLVRNVTGGGVGHGLVRQVSMSLADDEYHNSDMVLAEALRASSDWRGAAAAPRGSAVHGIAQVVVDSAQRMAHQVRRGKNSSAGERVRARRRAVAAGLSVGPRHPELAGRPVNRLCIILSSHC